MFNTTAEALLNATISHMVNKTANPLVNKTVNLQARTSFCVAPATINTAWHFPAAVASAVLLLIATIIVLANLKRTKIAMCSAAFFVILFYVLLVVETIQNRAHGHALAWLMHLGAGAISMVYIVLVYAIGRFRLRHKWTLVGEIVVCGLLALGIAALIEKSSQCIVRDAPENAKCRAYFNAEAPFLTALVLSAGTSVLVGFTFMIVLFLSWCFCGRYIVTETRTTIYYARTPVASHIALAAVSVRSKGRQECFPGSPCLVLALPILY